MNFQKWELFSGLPDGLASNAISHFCDKIIPKHGFPLLHGKVSNFFPFKSNTWHVWVLHGGGGGWAKFWVGVCRPQFQNAALC